jgi:transcription-repair coupling factor (superfamily II helicase)
MLLYVNGLKTLSAFSTLVTPSKTNNNRNPLRVCFSFNWHCCGWLCAYCNILVKAIEELKENEFKELYEEVEGDKPKVFVKETQLDTDFELLFPDDYINNITERLNLYTQLNAVEDEEGLAKFETELVDRFGELPTQAVDLFNSVRIKWAANSIGLEKVILKKNKFIGYFLADQQSPFYQTTAFTRVLQYVQSHPQQCQLKEKQTRNGLRLLLVFDGVTSVEKALRVLEPLTPNK